MPAFHVTWMSLTSYSQFHPIEWHLPCLHTAPSKVNLTFRNTMDIGTDAKPSFSLKLLLATSAGLSHLFLTPVTVAKDIWQRAFAESADETKTKQILDLQV